MKKYIEFIMRNKELNFTVDEDKAMNILKSPDQMIILKEEDGSWGGKSINKSEIIGTRVDKERTHDEHEKNMKKIALGEPDENSEEMRLRRAELVDKYKPDFLK